MADYNEQVERLWQEWAEETGDLSGDPDDFVDWALEHRTLAPRPKSLRSLLRKDVTAVLRQSKKYDEEGGFTYRAYQSVTLFDHGMTVKHYFDTDKGGTANLRQKSVKERRDGVANDVYRAVCDVERMNKMFPDEPQLNFFADFSDDIAEHRAAEQAARDKGEEAA
jgi:hypothetical protein